MSLITRKKELDEKYAKYDRKRAEAKGELKTYVIKLKELGINNSKQAKDKQNELKTNISKLESELENLINTMENYLKDIKDV